MLKGAPRSCRRRSAAAVDPDDARRARALGALAGRYRSTSPRGRGPGRRRCCSMRTPSGAGGRGAPPTERRGGAWVPIAKAASSATPTNGSKRQLMSIILSPPGTGGLIRSDRRWASSRCPGRQLRLPRFRQGQVPVLPWRFVSAMAENAPAAGGSHLRPSPARLPAVGFRPIRKSTAEAQRSAGNDRHPPLPGDERK